MRMYLIMKDFINSNIYLSLDYFVQKYDVSKRTIQNDLSYLMRISPRKGFTFHNKRGSGYLLEITNEELFKDFKTEKNFILVDAVMGDHGKLYPTYTREMQEKMRELMPYAAIVTPNLTEWCALIDEAYHETSNEQELKRMCEKLSQMGPKMIVVTGISIGHQILNFVYNHGKVEKIYAKRIGEDRSGTGDVISAVIAGSYLKEKNFLEAVKKSTDFASKCIQHSVDIDAHPHMGLCFEPLLKELGD